MSVRRNSDGEEEQEGEAVEHTKGEARDLCRHTNTHAPCWHVLDLVPMRQHQLKPAVETRARELGTDVSTAGPSGGPGILGKIMHRERGVRLPSHEDDYMSRKELTRIKRQERLMCGAALAALDGPMWAVGS